MTEVIDFNNEVLNFVTENYGSKMFEKVSSNLAFNLIPVL